MITGYSLLATILVGALVAVAVGGAAYKILRDKGQGKSSCGCQCKGCHQSNICQGK